MRCQNRMPGCISDNPTVMWVIFIPKPGIDLYRTFLESETSRMILRFYPPHRREGGVVEVAVATLGSGLSLASELRWYIRRYTLDLLFKTGDGVLLSHKLAREIYERQLGYPDAEWPHRYLCRISDGEMSFDQTVICTEDEVKKEE